MRGEGERLKKKKAEKGREIGRENVEITLEDREIMKMIRKKPKTNLLIITEEI